MAVYNKELPEELRRYLGSGVGSQDSVHQDSHIAPIAGPSNSSSNSFRSQADRSIQQPLSSAYSSFATQEGSWHQSDTSSDVPITAQSSLHWSSEDLQPRPEDSAAVLALLSSQSDEFDNVDALHQEIHNRQSLPWHNDNDARIPNDPVRTTGTADQAGTKTSSASYGREDYPYLYRMLSLSEDESLAAYLSENTYTDDVWGLPMHIKRDMDAVRSPETDSSTRAKALRRLEMLKSHLTSKQQVSSSTKQTSATEDDWAWIWRNNTQ